MFIQNQVLNNCYQIMRPLGKGGTSSVYLAYHLRLQKHVVIKQLRGSFTDSVLLRTEVDILKNLHHPNLPQVYDFIQDQNEVYTIIDFVDGYDLDAYIQSSTRFPEPLLKRYLRQIADVLDYLHSQNPPVIHSDIKPGNIIINQAGDAILIDFNTSIGGNQGNLLGLTLPYASPEQIRLAQYTASCQPVEFDLDGRSDIYSLGATFYELICGIQPTPGVRPVPLHTMGLTEYSRDFLILIDRMMEYDREKRPKSAKKLVTAIDRLDSRYRTYFALRCASLLLSAALISGGLYCCIRGGKRAVQENYQASYTAAMNYVSQGYLDQADETCDAILGSEELQAYLQDSPTELARLYHVMGDISYYREDYAAAAAYYYYSVNYCSAGSTDELAVYLRDAAIAYAQSGDLNTARSFLTSAQAAAASAEDLQLISVVIDARSGDVQQCLEGARKLIGESQNSELCLRAAMCAASVAEDTDSRIYWLETAYSYGGSKTVLRSLAAAYGQKAQQTTGNEQQAALEKATGLYAQLCGSVYASSTDAVNYSVILRMRGEDEKALDVLKDALQYDQNNYRILANMCFIYYEMGNNSMATRYCQDALQAWRADTSADRLDESSEEIQDLREIARRYGIGGI